MLVIIYFLNGSANFYKGNYFKYKVLNMMSTNTILCTFN